LGHSESDAHEIKSHPFFKEVDWDQIFEKRTIPPFKPKLLHAQDLRYFDKVEMIIIYKKVKGNQFQSNSLARKSKKLLVIMTLSIMIYILISHMNNNCKFAFK